MKKIKPLIPVMASLLLFTFSNNAVAQQIKIGTQTWAKKNLNVSTFKNGEVIPEAKTIEEWVKAGDDKKPAWCYYNNDPANDSIYGKLYNWYAVNDIRGLAPKGWHIPRDAEWTKLTDYLGGREVAPTKMKSISGWGNNEININTSGFTGLPGGNRYKDGTSFQYIGYVGSWWSSTEFNASDAWGFTLYNYNNGPYNRGYSSKHTGYSVRCIKD